MVTQLNCALNLPLFAPKTANWALNMMLFYALVLTKLSLNTSQIVELEDAVLA